MERDFMELEGDLRAEAEYELSEADQAEADAYFASVLAGPVPAEHDPRLELDEEFGFLQ